HIYAKIKMGHHQFLQCDRGCEHCSIGIDEALFLFTQLYGLNHCFFVSKGVFQISMDVFRISIDVFRVLMDVSKVSIDVLVHSTCSKAKFK
ncbi:hypothetical protein, partial [Planococcus glaciei]|uniref:hypothetical protein n=1 Tax=Planococcus glaciei TaxID=459472 RepID=UPI001C731CC1